MGRDRDLSDIRIFSGSAHPALAHAICDYLGVPLQPTITSRFSNDNLYVHLGASVREQEVFLIQPLSPPVSDHLLELLMMLDIARSASARSIHAVIPYYSYGRSDKKDAPRISITGRLIADLLHTAGATHVITMTLHSPQVHGFFGVPTDDLTARSVLARHFQGRDLSGTTLVSPDIGHAKRAAEFAQMLGNLPMAAGNKTRYGDNVVRVEIIGEVRGHHAILMDDEIATGSSMIETVNQLREKGITEVSVVCTHGVFTAGALHKLAAVPEITEIVTTDTLPIPEEGRPPMLHVLSVAPLFGEAIRSNFMGLSLGDLFIDWTDSVKPVRTDH
ncbi:MAG: ribose-phosphate pyrophosphokinase [Chloroflexi bacterium]|nr:ribose-phosphate pyrophosphokinase [Chloroflexota bacterium]